MTRLVILDRDGVINHDSDEFIKSADEWRAIDGSIDAISRLNAADLTVAVASNQSGIGRGLLSEDDLAGIHDKMRNEVERRGGRIDRIVYCPHLPNAGCDCRKPGPGMLLELANYYGVSLDEVPFIGDSLRDLQAAESAGAMPILVLTGYGERARQEMVATGMTAPVFDDLAAAVDDLLSKYG